MLKRNVRDCSARSVGARPRSVAMRARGGTVFRTEPRSASPMVLLMRFCAPVRAGKTLATKSTRAEITNRGNKRLCMVRFTLLNLVHDLKLRARWSPRIQRPDNERAIAYRPHGDEKVAPR